MAGRRKNKHHQDIVVPSRNISAASVVLTGPNRAPIPQRVFARHTATATSWYPQAWAMYDEVGEYHFAVNWVGNILSRATLYAARKNSEGIWKPAEGRPAELVQELFRNDGDQSQMLARFGQLLTVTGDSFLMGIPEADGTDTWSVASPGELSLQRGGGRRPTRMMLNAEPLPEGSAAIRVWRPHPNNRFAADSPTRAALPILSEIARLTRHVSAQVDSRLAGPGMFLLPNEMDFPKDEQGNPSSQLFVEELSEAMSAAVTDHSSTTSLAPIIMTGPGDRITQAKLMQFWSQLDENSVLLRTEAIRRLAMAMDMPPEILTGTGESRQWNFFAVDDAAIKVHAIPPLELLVSTLTTGYLWPVLMQENVEDADEYVILADTSQMRTRPNRSREALELFDRGQISAEAAVREVGFGREDMMLPAERREWLLMKVAGGSATPEQVRSALSQLGVEVADDPDGVPRETRPDPTLNEHPKRGELDKRTAQRHLTASGAGDPGALPVDLAEPLVLRALERAGSRMKSLSRGRGQPFPETPLCDAYLDVAHYPTTINDLMAGAWSTVDRLATERNLDPDTVTAALDTYTRALLVESVPHSRDRLRRFLEYAPAGNEMITSDAKQKKAQAA